MSSSNQVHTGRKGHPRLPCNGKAIDAKRDPAKRRWRFGGREQAKHVLGVVTWSAGRVSVVWFEPTTSVPDEGRICHLIQSDVLYRPPEGQPADDTRALGFASGPTTGRGESPKRARCRKRPAVRQPALMNVSSPIPTTGNASRSSAWSITKGHLGQPVEIPA